MNNSFSESYKAAGVDVTAGYKSVELMKKHVARTKIDGVISGIGGFGGSIGGGAEVGAGGTRYTAHDLRARRIDALMELKKRGVTP